jgi:hypothetical protein
VTRPDRDDQVSQVVPAGDVAQLPDNQVAQAATARLGGHGDTERDGRGWGPTGVGHGLGKHLVPTVRRAGRPSIPSEGQAVAGTE